MKELHLIANAHIDPIWQWQWNEGIETAIATFRSAADLAEEFDYIFCHNEAVLYEYIEKYSPMLFERIRSLVKAGKWKIMGGWYLQPDCNMPQGESFTRQILVAERYFEEKFGVRPKTGINVDSFGHSVGLPQIMKKCGQNAYICCRCGLDEYTPGSQFLWESPDGSQIMVNGAFFYYGTGAGEGSVVDKIKYHDEFFKEEKAVPVLWGVGNHGGGPSRINLREIKELIESGELNVMHSDPDTFFTRINPDKVHKNSMRSVMPGCYTSMHRLKARHAELENMLMAAEKICTAASMRGLMEYPEKEFIEATKDALKVEFHDSLPGTLVKSAEEQSLRIADHGIRLVEEARDLAFFRLSSQFKRAGEGEYPVLVFNPHPYEYETDITVELSLAEANWTEGVVSHFRVYDENGNALAFQRVKEESNLVALDWRKRFLIHAKLKPMQLTRISIFVDFLPPDEPKKFEGPIVVDIPGKHVEIDSETGLMKSFVIDGKEQLSGEAFRLMSYDDIEDPWAMNNKWLKGLGENPVPFALMEKPSGIFEGCKSVEVIEDGDIMTAVEAFFSSGNNKARIEYDIYKTNPYVDVKVDFFAEDFNKMIKLEIPYANAGQYVGQIPFGTEKIKMDGRETVAGRFMAIDSGEKSFALINKGVYGSSVKDGVISVSLLRTTTYCAHPIKEDEPLVRHDRYNKRMDMGESFFAFRLVCAGTEELERIATEFNEEPFALNMFPVEEQNGSKEIISVSDKNVTLVTAKKRDGGTSFLLRLFNNSSADKPCTVTVGTITKEFWFGHYEVKTVEYDGKNLTELEGLAI